jgi:multidrug efflux pump subunit AcrB
VPIHRHAWARRGSNRDRVHLGAARAHPTARMWIVKLALRRPYTFVVMSLLIAVLGAVTIVRMSVDIFPEIDIPVVAVLFNYSGMSPEDMEARVVSNFERFVLSTVSDIEHVESQSLHGVSVTKVFLQPDAKVEAAVAQISAVTNAALRSMPPGMFPGLIMRYSASNVPIIQVSLGGEGLSEQQLFDITANMIKPQMATVRGAQMPWPYGGKQRQIMVDLDPDKLYAWRISPSDVSNAINAQNVVVPAGTAKVGANEYEIKLNSAPGVIDALNDLPIKTVNGTPVYIRDVARVHDGFAPQTNIVTVDGKRGVVQPILKSGASTIDIVKNIKNSLPAILAQLPKELRVSLLADQSLFVRAAVSGVVKEAAIAGILTALMILLFLGSWRSTLIVVTSIPLSILVSIILLAALGHTLNIMTLGGMALAVGILVDDATVEIENIHRNLAQKKPIVQAILDGAQQIAVPAFVSTLCICIVFVPVAFITGAAKYLFFPLALAVVFAMMTSYFLSRTIVPTMIRYLLAGEIDLYRGHGEEHASTLEVSQGPIWRIHEAFNRRFEAFRRIYGVVLAFALERKKGVALAFVILALASAAIFPLIGRDFFPTVDAGQFRLHVRAPPGTRIEETERWFARVESAIREIVPADEVKTIIANIGIPNSGINLSLSEGTQISPADGELLVSLDGEHHGPTAEYMRRIRNELPDRFPNLVFYFQPPDIVTQVLNFGLPAPIDVQIVGPRPNLPKNWEVANHLKDEIAKIPGAADVHLHQVESTPEIDLAVDRTLANELGFTQRDVASDVLVSLSSSGQVAPNFFLEPRSGIQYNVAVMTPQYRIDSLQALKNTPVDAAGARQPQLLGNLATVQRGTGPTNVTHYNVAPTYDVLLNVAGTDLGRVSSEVDKVIERIRPTLPRGSTIVVRGQVDSMNKSFGGLASGLVFAILLVYMLMVVNFQSWSDPLIILMALPGALSGIVWMLFATGTTVSVPALMGAIMSIGVATSNSILLVTFANDEMKAGKSIVDAAWSAGFVRLRPVIMTALAMIIGMLPMSLGLGEGGEQNAPLGRAVIGGLIFATVATLFLVPTVYIFIKSRTKGPIHEMTEHERMLLS